MAVVPPGLNPQSRGKKKFIRNDFMGSAYQQIVDKVKRDMSRRAIRDINGNAQVFENQVEKEVGYRLLQESLDNNTVNDFDVGTHGATGLHQTGKLGTHIPSENQ